MKASRQWNCNCGCKEGIQPGDEMEIVDGFIYKKGHDEIILEREEEKGEIPRSVIDAWEKTDEEYAPRLQASILKQAAIDRLKRQNSKRFDTIDCIAGLVKRDYSRITGKAVPQNEISDLPLFSKADHVQQLSLSF